MLRAPCVEQNYINTVSSIKDTASKESLGQYYMYSVQFENSSNKEQPRPCNATYLQGELKCQRHRLNSGKRVLLTITLSF